MGFFCLQQVHNLMHLADVCPAIPDKQNCLRGVHCVCLIGSVASVG